MADSKITALTSISTSTDPAVDPLVIVDVSDTSMAATGTTKKVTLNQLLGSGGIATLASATITGDLTVGTNALKIFPATNRVIINQTAAIQGDALEVSVKSDGGGISLFGRASDNGATLTFRANGVTTAKASLTANDSGLSIRTGTVERYNIDTTGVSTWSVAGTTAMTLNSTANLVLKGGTVGANGVGLTFPATQVASSDANCLDDYKEAAFTPTIVGATTAGTGTYTTQNGRYTKIGNLVTFQVFIDWTAHTGTGNMRIGNLPFTNGSNFWAGSIGYANGIALTAGYVMTGYVESGQTFVTLQQYPTGGGGTTGIPMDTAGAIMFSGSYTV